MLCSQLLSFLLESESWGLGSLLAWERRGSIWGRDSPLSGSPKGPLGTHSFIFLGMSRKPSIPSSLYYLSPPIALVPSPSALPGTTAFKPLSMPCWMHTSLFPPRRHSIQALSRLRLPSSKTAFRLSPSQPTMSSTLSLPSYAGLGWRRLLPTAHAFPKQLLCSSCSLGPL